ncbi:MAG TPA: ribulose 1,5-bisphosphate carboxylase [Cyanobacteria bacterium UBA11159]|nr:ribulose 1,5-bisphosphate carboxylase [Cyanobacteria bacterium UBA11366]HBK63530.1 ribulose 1,5-bisphosphate carboxylase [Cyanobacteria bacterium UBA11166]HBR73705.1 ribulose 1,5-bisphosphate carboxylase [Cyanobacteria bacterium UBA11159]HBS67676.1 ribulose 1,5-bisphosphate carboxylase [Cyanobacteria bacterium UBA11153]HCA97785.1 ribulose 1,5-bisphosphate carboxylase [Cyanobacteria bacterium UBA9226]
MKYYIAPRFRDKLAVHITKNFLELPHVRVPLILGIHGGKGEGKSFQCELVFQQMGIGVVHISGGELESPDAGDPSRLIRLRYREAAEMIRVHGKMCVLTISDLDAGAGRIDRATQYTVNTQLVNATLMNIADHPTDVQLPGSYDATPLHRVPIIVTGNDFSTLYAPLIRDGRMEKFYWQPDIKDRIGIVGGIFAEDGLTENDIAQLIDTFPQQSIDFFSALRSRIYDEQIREFIHQVGLDKISFRIVRSTEAPPEFTKPNFDLPHLIEFGNILLGEQKQVEVSGLAQEYNKALRSKEVPQPNTAIVQPIDDKSTIHNGAIHPQNSQTSDSTLDPETQRQIREILEQGYTLSIEHGNERRIRTNAWVNGGAIPGNNLESAIASVQEHLTQYHSEYVRLIGTDPKAKRRVIEKIIQRPR